MSKKHVTLKERNQVIFEGINNIPRISEAIRRSKKPFTDDELYELVQHERERQANLKTYRVEVTQDITIFKTMTVTAVDENEIHNADLYEDNLDEFFSYYCFGNSMGVDAVEDNDRGVNFIEQIPEDDVNESFGAEPIDVAPLGLPESEDDYYG